MRKLIAIVLSIGLTSTSWADPATDLEMADDHLDRRYYPLDYQLERLAIAVEKDPDEVRMLGINFLPGLTTAEVGRLESEYGLVTTGVIYKAPLGDTGSIHAAGAGPVDMLATTGSFETRVNNVIKQTRCELLNIVPYKADRLKPAYIETAKGEFRIYSVHMYGRLSSLAALVANQASVRTLYLFPTNRHISNYEKVKSGEQPPMITPKSYCKD